MKFEQMDITPEMAEIMLMYNIRNRRVQNWWVDKLASDMSAGYWDFTPTPIVFDKSGTLIDGQQRLMAVIKSGVTCKFVVCKDAEHTYMIDGGRKRTVIDQLSMTDSVPEEFVNTRVISAVKSAIGGGLRETATTRQIEAYISDNVETISKLLSVIKGYGTVRGVTVKPVTYAILEALKDGMDLEVVKRFYEVLVTGIGSGTDLDAMVIRLRNLLIENTGKTSDRKTNSDTYERTKQVFNLYASKKPRKRIVRKSASTAPMEVRK